MARPTRPDDPTEKPASQRSARAPRPSSPRASLQALLRDEDLARLDALAPAFDPLEVLAWTHRERPHTRFLAWLLDPADPRPGGGHGLGVSFLRALVSRAVSAIETLPGVIPHDLPSDPGEVDARTVRVVREQPVGDGVRTTARAPDIRVTWTDTSGAPWLLVVENKVDAGEGEGQVRDYLAWARGAHPGARRLLVYVTPDGRAPDSRLDGEVLVPLSWSDVALAGLEALSRSAPTEDPASEAFVRAVLDALRARFGGRDDVRALIEALHDRHPRACALAASPAVESSLLEPLRARFPRAAYHLRSVQPRTFPWSRAWADRVARAFSERAGPDAPSLVPGAPHAECPDHASWSLSGITECLGLYVLCTQGPPLGGSRPRLWIALRAPGMTLPEALDARDQRAPVEALPEPTRSFLLGASPVYETPSPGGGWRWLCAGAPAPLPRGFSAEDDARRVAEAIHTLLGPHLHALRAFASDPDQRLFSCDLDPEHGLPVDDRDREALALGARPDAERVLLATCQPTGHMFELRRECELGVALGAAFGGSGALSYRYTHHPLSGPPPTVVVVTSGVLQHAEAATTLARVREALSEGATLLLLGGPWHPLRAQALLGDLASPVTFHEGGEELTAETVFVRGPDDREGRYLALAERDGRLLSGASWVTLAPTARVALGFRSRSPGLEGRALPLLASWRANGAKVVLWTGGAYGPWGRALRQRPEAFARWWRAAVAFGHPQGESEV